MPMARVQTDTNSSAGSHLLTGSSARRLSLELYAPTSGTAIISNDPQPAGGLGIPLSAGQNPVRFWREYHGELVGREWYVTYVGGASSMAFVEVID